MAFWTDWFSARNSARSIFSALCLNFNFVISRDHSFVSTSYLFFYTCLSLVILPLSSWVCFFQYFVSFHCFFVCFWASSSSLWVLSVSLILFLGFPFLLFKSSYFLCPIFWSLRVATHALFSRLSLCPPISSGSTDIAPTLYDTGDPDLYFFFSRPRVPVLGSWFLLTLFRAVDWPIGRSHPLLKAWRIASFTLMDFHSKYLGAKS